MYLFCYWYIHKRTSFSVMTRKKRLYPGFQKCFFFKKKFLKDRNKKTSIYFNKVTLVKNIDRQVWQDYLHRININWPINFNTHCYIFLLTSSLCTHQDKSHFLDYIFHSYILYCIFYYKYPQSVPVCIHVYSGPWFGNIPLRNKMNTLSYSDIHNNQGYSWNNGPWISYNYVLYSL